MDTNVTRPAVTGPGTAPAVPAADGDGLDRWFLTPAERGNPLGAGAQHQVVGVGEYDLCPGCAHGFGRKTFHRRLRAHRHEKRRCDQPVRGRDLAAAGIAVRCQQAEGKKCIVHRRWR